MFHVTCSIGLAQYRDDMQDLGAFLDVADQALYQAKGAGRDCVVAAPVAV
jgi:diguanylate cyclase (GGDEF)-like protein